MRHALLAEHSASLASATHTQILVLAIAGAALGLLGGIIGTIASYRAAKGPRERTSVLRGAALLVVVISIGVVAMVATSGPLKFAATAVYTLVLIWTIRALTRSATRARALDLEHLPPNQSTHTNAPSTAPSTAPTTGPTSSPAAHRR